MTRSRVTVVRLGVVAAFLISAFGVAVPSASALSYSRSTNFILNEVALLDLQANRNNVCHSGANLVIKAASGTFNRSLYAQTAAGCGMRVIWYFPTTVSYGTGTVYPSRVPAQVNLVKNLPNTYGYLSVKEPSWSHISGTEIRSLYRAFKAADPARPVVVLFGDAPHFGTSAN